MNSPVGLPDPIQTQTIKLAFVPLAALAALAGTTTALYQSAAATKPREIKSLPNTIKPAPTRTTPAPPLPVPKQLFNYGTSAYMAKGSAKRGIPRNPRTRGNVRVVSAPSARGGNFMNRAPLLWGNGSKLTIRHCEPFVAVNFTAAGVLAYATSPIIPASMPYLTGVASNFGKWIWRRLTLYYVPSCPTTADGELALGTYYDRQDAIAATFVQVASMTGGVATPPWGGGPLTGPGAVRIEVDCGRFDKPRYSFMASAAFAALGSSDQNNYCPVSLARASQGNTAGGAILGRVWCEYTVELLDPIVPGINV